MNLASKTVTSVSCLLHRTVLAGTRWLLGHAFDYRTSLYSRRQTLGAAHSCRRQTVIKLAFHLSVICHVRY